MLQPVSTEASHFGGCLNVLCTATVTHSASLATRVWQVCLQEEKRRELPYKSNLSIYLNVHSSGAVWESRWPSWAVRPNEPSGFRGRKELLNRASALATTCPWYVNWHLRTLSITSSSLSKCCKWRPSSHPLFWFQLFGHKVSCLSCMHNAPNSDIHCMFWYRKALINFWQNRKDHRIFRLFNFLHLLFSLSNQMTIQNFKINPCFGTLFWFLWFPEQILKNQNNNRLFMAPHLIRAQNIYKDTSIRSFHHTQW